MEGSEHQAPGGGARQNLLLPNQPRWPAEPEQPIVRLEGVVKRFEGKAVLDGLDLDVPTGLTTVICGQSGSGKSVLMKLMNGLLVPDEGRVLLFGEDTRELREQRLLELRKRIGTMFQNYALMDSYRVLENVGFPLAENTRMRWRDIAELARNQLELLGLGQATHKLPSQLSGGMKRRVSLARAVIANPEIVLFDDPTSGLDPVMTEFVDSLIERTRELFRITSVISSHNMVSALRLGDRIHMLGEGRIIAGGGREDVLASEDPTVKVFFEGVEMLQSGNASGDRSAEGGDGGGSGAEPSGDEEEADATDAVVRMRGVEKSFDTQKVLHGIDFVVPPREITVIIGGSGSGKSVIMKHIIGLMRPDSGSIRLFGEEVADMPESGLRRLRLRIGMLFQSAALLDSMTIRENVAFPLMERGWSKQDVARRTDEVLESLHIAELGRRLPSDISSGQKKRAGLARAIAPRPDLMIYDEPTTGQDPVMTRYVDDMIVEAQELFDITSLVVSHDMTSTFRIAHRVAMLHEGAIHAYGSPGHVAASRDPWVRRFIYAGTPEGERASAELGLHREEGPQPATEEEDAGAAVASPGGAGL